MALEHELDLDFAWTRQRSQSPVVVLCQAIWHRQPAAGPEQRRGQCGPEAKRPLGTRNDESATTAGCDSKAPHISRNDVAMECN